MYRAISRAQIGENVGDNSAKKWFQGCLDDCNCVLIFDDMSGTMDEYTKANQIMIFMTRGRALRRLGKAEEALVNFRAACAAIRLIGASWKREPTIRESTREVLYTLATIKKGKARPHYTDEERETWQRELGVGLYSKDVYKCGYCGAQRSDSVKLMQCSRCKQRWFCSKDCLANAWKNGHKTECKRREEIRVLSILHHTSKSLD